MKTFLQLASFAFLGMAALATPIAIGIGIYEWAVVDALFKEALWIGFKNWIIMLVVGIGIGVPMFLYSYK